MFLFVFFFVVFFFLMIRRPPRSTQSRSSAASDVYKRQDSGFIAQEEMNRMYNRAAVIPVDGNPGIINGVHLRMFEALAAGALPLIEYRNDVDSLLFNGFEDQLPLVRDYRKVADMAEYYLNNERERSGLVYLSLIHI